MATEKVVSQTQWSGSQGGTEAGIAAQLEAQHASTTCARVISAPKAVQFLTVEPGRVSLHGVALTDAEYAMLRAIAERMRRSKVTAEVVAELAEAEAHYAETEWIDEVPTC